MFADKIFFQNLSINDDKLLRLSGCYLNRVGLCLLSHQGPVQDNTHRQDFFQPSIPRSWVVPVSLVVLAASSGPWVIQSFSQSMKKLGRAWVWPYYINFISLAKSVAEGGKGRGDPSTVRLEALRGRSGRSRPAICCCMAAVHRPTRCSLCRSSSSSSQTSLPRSSGPLAAAGPCVWLCGAGRCVAAGSLGLLSPASCLLALDTLCLAWRAAAVLGKSSRTHLCPSACALLLQLWSGGVRLVLMCYRKERAGCVPVQGAAWDCPVFVLDPEQGTWQTAEAPRVPACLLPWWYSSRRVIIQVELCQLTRKRSVRHDCPCCHLLLLHVPLQELVPPCLRVRRSIQMERLPTGQTYWCRLHHLHLLRPVPLSWRHNYRNSVPWRGQKFVLPCQKVPAPPTVHPPGNFLLLDMVCNCPPELFAWAAG